MTNLKSFYNKPYIKSFVLNTLFFITIYLLFGFNFNTIDDVTVSQMLNTKEISLFSFNWISYLCWFLNNLFPNINGYGLLMITGIFISSLKVVELILNSNKEKYLRLFLYSIMLFWILFQVQFTITATFCAITGIIAINEWLENKKINNLILGIPLLLLGYSLRKSTIVFIIVFIFFLLFKTNNKKELTKKILAFGLVFATLYSVNILNTISQPNDLKEYLTYNSARSRILDYQIEGTNEYLQYNKLSENDYLMLSCWIVSDKDFFTIDKFNEIHADFEKTINKNKTNIIVDNIINNSSLSLSFGFIFILLTLLFSCSREEKKNKVTLLLIFLAMIGFVVLYSIINRFSYRIYFSACIPLILYLILYQKKIVINKILYILLAMTIFISSLQTFDILRIKNSYKESIVNLTEEFNNKDNIYFWSFPSMLFLEKSVPVLNKTAKEYQENVIDAYWTMNSNYLNKKQTENNIENQITDLYKKDNYYLVTAEEQAYCDIIINYIKEHYNIDVEYELLKEDKNFRIYKLKEYQTPV